MTLKQYNPVKVKDPSSDGYSIRLHPRQSFQLILTKVFEDEEFDVKLDSDFLVLEEYADLESKEVYCFSQKQDLERWSQISTMFLGNLTLTIKPIVEGKKETEVIRMCVFLNCADKNKANVVTVINPDGHLLKIESNQIVHVVMFDTHYARWNLVGIENLGMSCARSETVFNDVSNVYDATALFCPEPRNIPMPINPALDNAHNTVALKELNSERKLGAKEYHFFTHLNLAALKKANSSPNGNYPMGEMQFTCKNEEGTALEERSMTLMMALKGSGKRISIPEFQAVRHNTRFWNTPYMSSSRQCVMSPGFNESVDLPANADTLYIEIPQPSVYFTTERMAEDCFWSSKVSLDTRFGLRVKELNQRYVNGFMVQRFMVGGILAHKPPGDLLFIGALRFCCRSYKGEATFEQKSISLSLWKVRGVSEDRRKTAEFSYVGGGGGRTIYRKPDLETTYQQQQVTYEEELEQLHSDFDGIKVVSLSEIDGKPSISLIGCYDYDDLMCGTHYSSKKKREATTSTGSSGFSTQGRKRGVLGYETRQEIEVGGDNSNWYNWFDMM